MDQREAIWHAHQRRRWMQPDAVHFIRPDAYRFMPPGGPRWVGQDAVRYFWPERKHDQPANADHSRADAIDDMEALVVRGQLRRLQRELSEVRFELKFRHFLRSLKYGFNSDQPRVPAGNSDGGQWTSGGGGSTGQNRIRLAGEIPTNDPPEIPKQRPSTAKLRNLYARQVGRWLARIAARELTGPIGTFTSLLEAASWLSDADVAPWLESSQDPPKTLEELQQAVSTPQPGYDIHHIVEQTAAIREGFPRSLIDGPENLVRIPTWKHWEINAWYNSLNEDYGGLTPRQYLRGKEWSERTSVGLKALVDVGVLKP